MDSGWRRNYIRYKSYFLNVSNLYRENNALKVYLEILLSLATVSLFAVFALRPTLLTIAQLVKEIEVKQETLDKMNKKLRDVHNAQIAYDQLGSKINYLDTAIPSNSSVDIFARQIEALTLKNSTILTSIVVDETTIFSFKPEKNNSKEEEKSKIKPLPNNANSISFSITTTTDVESYGKLFSLLQDMENLRWPTKIDHLTISKEFDRDKKELLELTIDGRLPYIIKELSPR